LCVAIKNRKKENIKGRIREREREKKKKREIRR
jgi:hypothetical protein